MTSKYDSYWAERLSEVHAAVEQAAAGSSGIVSLTGLRSTGDRQSWQGTAEVCGRIVTRSSMAHAASLGKLIAASGICAAWTESTFRFTIAASGDVLAVSTTGSRVTPPPGPRTSHPGTGSGPRGDGTAAVRFYQALSQLTEILGGPRCLRDCDGAGGWPRLGVYFFFEPGEVRADGGDRVVRVGTHALTATSQTTLWDRLRQHRGHVGGRHPGGGNHRASVFRRHVGGAIIQREKLPPELLGSWLDRHGPWPGQAAAEARIETQVSSHIGSMPFIWLNVPERDDRGCIERNSIALTSCLAEGQNQPSAGWLGRDAAPADISQSGLWNVDLVRHQREAGFLDLLDKLIRRQQALGSSSRTS